MRHNWSYKTIGDVCSSVTDGSHNPPKGIDISNYRMISSQNIFDDHLIITDDNVRFLSKESHIIEDKRTKLQKDVVLLTIVGTIGRACVLSGKEGPLTLQRSVAALRPSEEILPRYLMHTLIGNRTTLKQEAHGIAQKGLYLKQLSALRIPVPPIEIQKKVVAELDKINELIRLKKEQLSDYDKLAQSIFYDMFGDPVENGKGWGFLSMEEVCFHIVDCPHSTPKKVDYKTNYPCIRTSELRGGTISWDSMQYLEEEEYIIRIARLQPIAGDIVFGREGTIGDAVILPKGYSFSLGQRTMLLRADSSIISNVYLHRVILSEWVKQQIDYVNVSSTVAHVNIKDFKKFTIPIPPLSLQQTFAQRIELIEKQKAEIKSTIANLETLLASRMLYWFD